jgi:hypothetical protein
MQLGYFKNGRFIKRPTSPVFKVSGGANDDVKVFLNGEKIQLQSYSISHSGTDLPRIILTLSCHTRVDIEEQAGDLYIYYKGSVFKRVDHNDLNITGSSNSYEDK